MSLRRRRPSDGNGHLLAEYDIRVVMAMHACLDAMETNRTLLLALVVQYHLRDPGHRSEIIAMTERSGRLNPGRNGNGGGR